MEYLGVLWILVPVVAIAAGIIKYLFWFLLIALLFSADDTHLKNSRKLTLAAIAIFVLVMVVLEKAYNFVGVAYGFGGLLTYGAFHFISGVINKTEKRRKLELKKKSKL